METYRTEEEQIEAIKKFVGDHGSKVLAVLVLSIGSFFGFQHWQQSEQQKLDTASGYYADLSTAATASAELSAADQKKFDDAYGKLLAEFPQSVYASYAALHKAKLAVAKNELDNAAEALQWAIDANAAKDVVTLANLRLARVELARGNLDKAAQLLNKQGGAFEYAYQITKGDVLVAQGKNAEALTAYKKAQTLQPENAQFSSQVLTIKIDSLEAGDTSKLFPVATETK